MRITAGALSLALMLLAGACASGEPTVAPSDISQTPPRGALIRVLMLTATAGFRHDSIATFYTFRDNPRGRVQVLLRLDAMSVGSTGDYPLAWAQSFGTGRAYYNALGHFPETWTDPRFQRQLIGAIRWTGKRD